MTIPNFNSLTQNIITNKLFRMIEERNERENEAHTDLCLYSTEVSMDLREAFDYNNEGDVLVKERYENN